MEDCAPKVVYGCIHALDRVRMGLGSLARASWCDPLPRIGSSGSRGILERLKAIVAGRPIGPVSWGEPCRQRAGRRFVNNWAGMGYCPH